MKRGDFYVKAVKKFKNTYDSYQNIEWAYWGMVYLD